ncbi:hypothetical protein Scep_022117 [Stephania cephalantha]|uniref:Uncharacterized protein n=1 Tax=Stephania cephalantha TaxID=152367 RepID=A0AAP0F9U2_9MAGN
MRGGEEEEAGKERRKGGDVTGEVDTGDQLATKDSVDLDSGIDYGVLECVVSYFQYCSLNVFGNTHYGLIICLFCNGLSADPSTSRGKGKLPEYL